MLDILVLKSNNQAHIDEIDESVTEKKSKIIRVHCFLSIQN